jgi:hypothetical protein
VIVKRRVRVRDGVRLAACRGDTRRIGNVDERVEQDVVCQSGCHSRCITEYNVYVAVDDNTVVVSTGCYVRVSNGTLRRCADDDRGRA